MSSDMNRVIHECFRSGSVGESCDDCPAHPANGGPCCFGMDHEEDHEDCQDCDYESECARLTHGHSPKRRIPIRRRNLPIAHPQVRRTSEPLLDSNPGHRTVVRRRQEEDEIEQRETPEQFINKLIEVTGWGMVEGGLQMALSYFQRNRPR
jgi:hypothetical protein